MDNPYQAPEFLANSETTDSKIPFVGRTGWSTRSPVSLNRIIVHLFAMICAGLLIFVSILAVEVALLWRSLSLIAAIGTVSYSLYQIIMMWRQRFDVAVPWFSESRGYVDEHSLYIDSGPLQQEISLSSIHEARRFSRISIHPRVVFCWDDSVLGCHGFHLEDFNNPRDFQQFVRRLSKTGQGVFSPNLQNGIFFPREVVLPLPALRKHFQATYPAPLLLPEFSSQIVGQGILERTDFNSETIRQIRAKRRVLVMSRMFSGAIVLLMMFAAWSYFICAVPVVIVVSMILLANELEDSYYRRKTAIRYAVAFHPKGVAWATGSVISQATWSVFRSYVIEADRLLLEIANGDSFLLIPKRFFTESQTPDAVKELNAEHTWEEVLELVKDNLPARVDEAGQARSARSSANPT